MPKVTYTAAKGLVQETGSGFDVTSDLALTGALTVSGNATLSGASTLASTTVSTSLDLLGTGILKGQKRSTSILATGTTLTAADSGKVFFLVQAGGARTATLPALENGLNFKFIVTTAAAGNWSISTAQAADDFVGSVVAGDGNAGDSAADADTLVRFVGGTAAAGDQVELECDGTDWYIRGSMKVTGGIIFA